MLFLESGGDGWLMKLEELWGERENWYVLMYGLKLRIFFRK